MEWHLEYDADDHALILRSATGYLSIRVTASDVRTLSGVDGAAWVQAHSVLAGAALGHPVYWCHGEQPDTLQVLVGPDEQTWQMAVTLPLSELQSAVAGAGSAAPGDAADEAQRRVPGTETTAS